MFWDLARGLIVAGYIAVVGYWLLWAFWCLSRHTHSTTRTTTQAEAERLRIEAERRYKSETNASPDR